jgi:hypothetical protein
MCSTRRGADDAIRGDEWMISGRIATMPPRPTMQSMDVRS